jgi:hypothetical protein
MRYIDLTIYPSHYFIPTHLTGLKYQGSGPVFAEQLWATTFEQARRKKPGGDAKS